MLRYFRPYLLVPEWADTLGWWLEFDGVPLRWNYPVGLLLDQLVPQLGAQGAPQGAQGAPQEAQGAPQGCWHLTLRHRSYPEGYVLPLQSLEDVRAHWLNQLKESCYVLNGTAKPVMQLSTSDTALLWDSVLRHDLHDFWSVFGKLLPGPGRAKHIPTRFYFTVSDKVIDLPIGDAHDTDTVTVGEVLHGFFPDLFGSPHAHQDPKPLVHGIVVPTEAPLLQLYRECVYIDGFLHITIASGPPA